MPTLPTDPLDLSALDLGRIVAAREISPVELVRAVYARLDATEPAWHCFVARTEAAALAEAAAAEREIAPGGYRGPLHGLPLAVKDNIAVAHTVTAAGARFLAGNVTAEDAGAVARLRTAGAIVVGKTNLSELALSSTTINPHFGTTHNPWRTNPDARVLLTTFSDALANALRIKPSRLIGNELRVAERVEVYAVPAVARRLYERTLGHGDIAPRETIREIVRDVAGQSAHQRFSLAFLVSEWEEVVGAWQLTSWEAYRDVARLGRRTRLPEARRAVLWAIFEQVSTGGLP